MAQYRLFNASNEPGTCKWCGRALRRLMHVETERGPIRKRSKCCNAPVEQPRPGGFSTLGECSKCGDYVGHVTVTTSRTPVYDKLGHYGDGHFCGLRCGYEFGVSMADIGKQLVRKDDNSR